MKDWVGGLFDAAIFAASTRVGRRMAGSLARPYPADLTSRIFLDLPRITQLAPSGPIARWAPIKCGMSTRCDMAAFERLSIDCEHRGRSWSLEAQIV